MSKATKGTSTLFPQVSRGESADAAKALLDDAGDSSGDEAHYRQSIRLATPVQFTRDLRVCGVLVTYRHGYLIRSKVPACNLRSPKPRTTKMIIASDRKTLASVPDGWARGEREGYGGPAT